MSNIIRFPASRHVPAARIPRERFAALAELALDVVDQIVTLLDAADGDLDLEPDADGKPSPATPCGGSSQIIWTAGGNRDPEGD